MKIYFTRHAKNRMRWRGIPQTNVIETIHLPERREIIGPDRYHHYRHWGKQYIRVTLVVEAGRYVVISVADRNN